MLNVNLKLNHNLLKTLDQSSRHEIYIQLNKEDLITLLEESLGNNSEQSNNYQNMPVEPTPNFNLVDEAKSSEFRLTPSKPGFNLKSQNPSPIFAQNTDNSKSLSGCFKLD